MKVLSLRCAHGHGFEGWFGSEDDYRAQSERGLVTCPVCSDAEVTRLPTAARFNRSSRHSPKTPREEPPPAAAPAPASAEASPSGVSHHITGERSGPESLWMHAVRRVLARTEDVGTRFPDEARRIHYGEVPERGIRGLATPEEAEALRDEGIEVHNLPLPDSLKGPLQ